MILTIHAIAGAAIGSLLPGYPVTALVLGFASHFALDAIPHWDYPIGSASIHPKKGGALTLDRTLMHDLFHIGFDFALGIGVSLLFFHQPAALLSVLAGLIGGVLPDFLQFVYTRFPNSSIRHLQKFHEWIHSPRRLRDEVKTAIGIAAQAVIIVAIIALAKMF